MADTDRDPVEQFVELARRRVRASLADAGSEERLRRLLQEDLGWAHELVELARTMETDELLVALRLTGVSGGGLIARAELEFRDVNRQVGAAKLLAKGASRLAWLAIAITVIAVWVQLFPDQARQFLEPLASVASSVLRELRELF